MNSYQTIRASNTSTSVVIAGILASQLLAGGTCNPEHLAKEDAVLPVSYRINASSASYDQVRTIFGSVAGVLQGSFVNCVSDFYSKLLTAQEPLEHTFSVILHENLWDLYER